LDLSLLGRAVWRYKWLAVLGIVVAIVLAGISVARVHVRHGSVSVTYRQSQKWTSTSTVWVTQNGFPLGRTVYDQCFGKATPSAPSCVPKLVDPTSLGGRTPLYASLVSSDEVKQIMLESGPVRGTVVGFPVTAPNNQNFLLPFFGVSGIATSPAGARSLAERAATAMLAFVQQQQAASDTPAAKRVVLKIVQHANPPVLTNPRSKTRPVAVFLATLLVVLGLILLLENRRRVRAQAAAPEEPATVLDVAPDLPPLPAAPPSAPVSAIRIRVPNPVGDEADVSREGEELTERERVGYGWSSPSR
jgi:hypothetical protein